MKKKINLTTDLLILALKKRIFGGEGQNRHIFLKLLGNLPFCELCPTNYFANDFLIFDQKTLGVGGGAKSQKNGGGAKSPSSPTSGPFSNF